VADKFKILSLDGGGVRGYLSIKILQNIEAHLNEENSENIPIGERFDLIVGTSTGAIIAALLAFGETAEDVLKKYEKDIPEIFGDKMKQSFPFNIFPFSLYRSKYKSDSLEEKAKKYFKEATFDDLNTDLIVTSVDITSMSPRLHKSNFLKRNLGRKKELLTKAIIASTAAPAYFKAARGLLHSDYLIDGGVVANNPSLIAMIDALQFERTSKRGTKAPSSITDLSLLSIGTGKIGVIPYELKSLENTTIRWLMNFKKPFTKPTKPIIDVLMESQSKIAEFQTQFLFQLHENKDSYLRINPTLMTEILLDDASKIPILNNLADLKQYHLDWVDKHLLR